MSEAEDAMGRTMDSLVASIPAASRMGVTTGRWDSWRVKRHLQRSSRHQLKAQRIILRSARR